MPNNGDFMSHMIGYLSTSKIICRNGRKCFSPNFSTAQTVKLTCDVIHKWWVRNTECKLLMPKITEMLITVSDLGAVRTVYMRVTCTHSVCFTIVTQFWQMLFQEGFLPGFTARQDYFTHVEPSQAVCGTKTGDPTRKQNLACLTCDVS